jgi:hypothetical protein
MVEKLYLNMCGSMRGDFSCCAKIAHYYGQVLYYRTRSWHKGGWTSSGSLELERRDIIAMTVMSINPLS